MQVYNELVTNAKEFRARRMRLSLNFFAEMARPPTDEYR
jgi:hypothetical protein